MRTIAGTVSVPIPSLNKCLEHMIPGGSVNRVMGLLYEQLSDPGAAGSELNCDCGEFTKIVNSHSIKVFSQVCSFSAFEQQRFILKQSVDDF